MKINTDYAIEIKHVSKEYTIHHEKPTLVEKFVNKREEKFHALTDISISIRKGERVGIIGSNGSGKTTLLKIISGITSPTSGTINSYGKIISLIEISAGFKDDLSGYQNIFLNGLLLGMRHAEIQQKLNDIIDFADIKQFIDAPLFTYSSGMVLRLGFAVAIASEPDILIVDEGLSVGDQSFQQKAYRIIKNFSKTRTMITVSHDLSKIAHFCNRVIWIDRGIVRCDGKSNSVLRNYITRMKS